MLMKEPGQHQIWESSPVAQPLKNVPVVMANNCSIEVATSACITTDLSPTQLTKCTPLTLEVDNLPQMKTPSPEVEKDTYRSIHSKTALEEQRAPSRKSKWMWLMRMQLNSIRAQKLRQQAERFSPETDKPRSEHLSVRRDTERNNSADERSKLESPTRELSKRTAISTHSLATHRIKSGSSSATDQELADSPTGLRSPTIVSHGSGNELNSKHFTTTWSERTANVRGRLSSFWRQAALAALRNQHRANKATADSRPTNASLSILEELFQESWPTASQVQQWQDSFQHLLQDKDGLRVFQEFLRGEFSDENIEFWIACQQYKSLGVGDHSKAEAKKIYETFIAFQSLREVNLDCETRLQTESRLAEAGPDLFDACQKRIEALMEKDPYIRFLRSALYYKLKEVTGVSAADSTHQTSSVLDCGNIKQMSASSPLSSDIPLVLSLPQNSIPSPQVAWEPPSDRVCTDVLDKVLTPNFDKNIALQAPYSPLLDAIVVNSPVCTPSKISLRDNTRGDHGQNRHSIDLSDMVIQ